MKPFIVFLMFILIGTSCEADEQRGQVLEFIPRQLEIPAALNPRFAWVFEVGTFSTDHERFESITGTPWDDWTRVEPARASLLINESGLDWGFVQELSISAYKGDDPAAAKEIFYNDIIRADAGNRLDLIPTDFDANLGLLDGDEFTLVLELTTLRRQPPQSIPVVIQYSFEGFVE
jgi:hypothetical protein